MKKNNENTSKGITLVALVVTIVVLLILAGITMSLVLGNNGILKKAGEARDRYGKAQNDEQAELLGLTDELKAYVGDDIPDSYVLKWDIGYVTDYTAGPSAEAYLVNDEESGYYDLLLLGNGKLVNAYNWVPDPDNHTWWMYSDFETNYKEKIKKVKISAGITELGSGTFYGLSNTQSIDFPSNLKHFRHDCFTNSKWLNDKRNENPIVTVNNILVDGKNCTGELEIPSGVEAVEEYALSYNNNITKVDIPDSVTELRNNSFNGCANLTDATGGNNVMYLGDAAFISCGNFVHYHYSNNLKKIGCATFEWDYKFADVQIPDGVEEIGQRAFNHNKAYEGSTIRIPASVKVLGNLKHPSMMFFDCGKVENFTAFEVDAGNPNYKTEDGILYTKDGSVLVAIPMGKTFTDNTYVMPDSVTTLGELSFGVNTNINKIVISDNLLIQDCINEEEKKAGYLNDGNSLSIATYTYNSVKLYDVKDTNTNYTSGIKVLGQTHEFGSEENQGYILSKDGSELIAMPVHCTGYQMLPSCVTTIRKNAFYIFEIDNDGNFKTNDSIYNQFTFRINKDTINIEDQQLKYINWLAKDNTNRSQIYLQIQGTNSKYDVVDNQFVLK